MEEAGGCTYLSHGNTLLQQENLHEIWSALIRGIGSRKDLLGKHGRVCTIDYSGHTGTSGRTFRSVCNGLGEGARCRQRCLGSSWAAVV